LRWFLVANFLINRAVVLFDRLIGRRPDRAWCFLNSTVLGLPKLITTVLPKCAPSRGRLM